MRWHLRCTFQLFLFGLCTPSRPFIKMFIRKNKNRLHGDHFRITVEPVIVKRYRKTLANRGFYKKKLDTRFDTYCIKTGVQLWSEWGDLNPRPLGPEPSALPAALHPVSPPIIFPDGAAVKYNFPTFTCMSNTFIRCI